MKRKMKILLTLGFFFVNGSFAAQKYHSETMTLVLGFEAKMMCSCLYVMKHSRDYCEKFIQLDINRKAHLVVNEEERRVSSLIGPLKELGARHASFRNEDFGCQLDN